MENILAFMLLALITSLWVDSLRAREKALALADQACLRYGVQMLDQTVAIQSIRLTWQRGGLRLKRCYLFEFSDGGIGRQQGRIRLIGVQLDSIELDQNNATADRTECNEAEAKKA